MAVSATMVVLGGILNAASVVAIFSGVVGKQEGGWYGSIALLLGLVVVGVFIYARKQSIWNFWIRGALIALSVIIFLVSAIGMADNWRTDFGGQGYVWSQGRDTVDEEIIRVVPQTFVVLDVDFIVLMMLIGSIGIAAVAIWGAFNWEKAKIEEVQQEGIRDLLDELPPDVLRPGANYREELERHYASGRSGTVTPSVPPVPNPVPSQTSPNVRRCPRCWTDQYENAKFCHACGAGS